MKLWWRTAECFNFLCTAFLQFPLSTICNSNFSIICQNTPVIYTVKKYVPVCMNMLWESVILCAWFMYLRGLSTPAPQLGTSWWHRWWSPAGNRGHTWLGSLLTVWSWGSSYSSMSRPLSRSSRPAACREQWRKREMAKTLTTTVRTFHTIIIHLIQTSDLM